MSADMRPQTGNAVVALLFVAAMLVTTGAAGKSTGVVEDPAVQSGPCYDALVDKNAATPSTAPNRELGAACEAEHGDIDKAWARVIRLWGSDSTDIPDYDSYRRADAPMDGAAPRWLGWAGLVLIYAVLGTPMRSAARLMGAHPRPASGSIVDVVACLAIRALIAAVLVFMIGLPYLAAACGIALIAWLMVAPRLTPPRPKSSQGGAASALAVHLADWINDGLGAAAGLAALALLAQHNVAVLAAGLALALVASAGPVIAGRRALLATRLGAATGPALLAALIGEVLILVPPFAGWIGDLTGASVIAPFVLAMLTLAAGWRWSPPPAKPADLQKRTIEGGSG